MCMMTVRYTAECGGDTVMENVSLIRPDRDGLTLVGLLDGENALADATHRRDRPRPECDMDRAGTLTMQDEVTVHRLAQLFLHWAEHTGGHAEEIGRWYRQLEDALGPETRRSMTSAMRHMQAAQADLLAAARTVDAPSPSDQHDSE